MGIVAMVLPLSAAIMIIAFRISEMAERQENVNWESLLPYLPAVVIGVIVAIIIGLVTQIGLYLQAGSSPSQPVMTVLGRALKLLPKYLLASLLLFVVALGGFFLFVIPAIIWSIWYGFAPLIALFENKTGWAAMERSKQIVKGRSWAVFGRLLFLALMLALIEMAISLPFALVHEALGEAAGSLVNILVLTPVGAIYSYHLYKELATIADASAPTA